jgi:molybdopterin-binding protein
VSITVYFTDGGPVETLDVESAARLLHLHPRRVQSLARAGKLPAVRVGRRWLFQRERLEALLGRATPARTATSLSLSARNRLRGRITGIRADGIMAEVRLRIGDQELVSVITRTSADALGLREGDEVLAVIKSTEVMIGRDEARS